MNKLFLSCAVLMWLSGPMYAAGPEEGLFNAAKTMIANAQTMPEAEKLASYRSANDLLDLIRVSYGTSDIGQGIIAADVVQGIDISALNNAVESSSLDVADPVLVDIGNTIVTNTPKTISTVSVAEPEAPEVPLAEIESVPGLVELAPLEDVESSDEQLAVLVPLEQNVQPRPLPERPEKEIVTDVQNELNRLGCSVGRADGVAGRKTASGFSMFLRNTESDLAPEDLKTEAAVEALQAKSAKVCSLRWVADNAPDRLGGSWGFRADCKGLFGRAIRMTGNMKMKYQGGGRATGTVSVSNGAKGTVVSERRGNTIVSTMRYAAGTVSSQLTMSSNNMTASGRDSNGCKVVSWKN